MGIIGVRSGVIAELACQAGEHGPAGRRSGGRGVGPRIRSGCCLVVFLTLGRARCGDAGRPGTLLEMSADRRVTRM